MLHNTINIIGDIMSGIYTYSPGVGRNNYYGRLESTIDRENMPREELARRALKIIHKMPHAGAQSITLEMLLACIEDSDGDGYDEIDLNKLLGFDITLENGISFGEVAKKKLIFSIYSEIALKDRNIAQFFPEPSCVKERMSLLDTAKAAFAALNMGKNMVGAFVQTSKCKLMEISPTDFQVFYESITIDNSIEMVKGRDMEREFSVEASSDRIGSYNVSFSLPQDHSLGDAVKFFNRKYVEINDVDHFNAYLRGYLDKYYVHLWDTLPDPQYQRGNQPYEDYLNRVYLRGYYQVNANISDATRTTWFSIATTASGDKKARVDCDVFALIAFHLLSNITDEEGNPVFTNIKLIYMYSPDGKAHMVLLYTHSASGRTFVLDNSRVTEITGSSKEDYFYEDYFIRTYPSFDTFREYVSPEEYYSKKFKREFHRRKKDPPSPQQ